MKKLTCVISGSFRKSFPEIKKLIELFRKLDVNVLSPEDTQVVSIEKGFARLAYERPDASPLELENNHLKAIAKANFLFICNPDGIVGKSTVFEIGYALALRKPIYSLQPITNIPFNAYAIAILPDEIVKLF